MWSNFSCSPDQTNKTKKQKQTWKRLWEVAFNTQQGYLITFTFYCRTLYFVMCVLEKNS